MTDFLENLLVWFLIGNTVAVWDVLFNYAPTPEEWADIPLHKKFLRYFKNIVVWPYVVFKVFKNAGTRGPTQ